MANHEQVKNALSKILIDSNKKSNHSIAILGEWGVGKTYLWKDFYGKNRTELKDDKYAYISLFGISSLEELKLKIATEAVSIDSKKGLSQDVSPYLKKLGSIFTSANFSESGVSIGISSSITASIILTGLQNTLVCFDDLERRGKNLPIDEVMGLVNYLTEERNCSVVCLLNKNQLDDEKYEEYKEKVFSYELSLDDSLDLIKELLPDDIEEIISNFYEIFQIKNIRLYESSHHLYIQFIDALDDNKLSTTSKNNIFSSILLLNSIDKMPKVMGINLDKFIDDYSEKNYLKQYISSLANESQPSNKSQEISTSNKLKQKIINFKGYFKIDQWELAILDFMNRFEVDNTVSDIINKDIFNEKQLKNKRELDSIVDEFYDLRCRN